MTQFKVPQNVQREDTIIGPVTLKQLGILAAGGAVAYAIFVSLSATYFIEIWLPPVAIVAAITLAFAFLKIHNLQFHIFLMNFIEYKLLSRNRLWIQGSGDPFISLLDQEKNKKKTDPKAGTEEKKQNIEELTNLLDTHGQLKKNN